MSGKGFSMLVRTAVVLVTLMASSYAQHYGLSSVISTLTSPSGLPLVQHLVSSAPNNEPSQCLLDLQTYLTDLGNSSELYAQRISTSFGEFPDESVIFTWTGYDYGVIEQCEATKEGDVLRSKFSTHYCMAVTMLDTLEVQVGTCWPVSCGQEEIQEVADAVTRIIFNSTDPMLSFVCFRQAPWDADAIAVLSFFCVIAAIVLIATVYELHFRKHFLGRSSRADSTSRHSGTAKNGIANAKYVSSDDEVPTKGKTGADLEDTTVLTTGDEVTIESSDSGVTSVTSTAGGEYGAVADGKMEPMSTTETEGGGKDGGLLDKILMSFSASSNLRVMLSAKTTSSNLGVINGLRVLSMFWIILLHCQLFLYGSKKPDNYFLMLSTSGNFARLAVGSTFSVDTFFVIGGLLVTYVTLRKLDKTYGKGMNWLVFYLHRYWRLTPALLGALALWISLGVHMAGQGVMLEYLYDFVNAQCKKIWWTYPLYINNLVPFPGNTNESCMGWAWYLACDMQFYLLSPIFICALHKKKKLGLALLVTVTLASIATTMGIVWYYGINPAGRDYNNRTHQDDDVTYTKPYTRIHSYTVGMLVGYALYHTAGRKVNIPMWVVLPCWLVAAALCMTCVYGLYDVDNLDQWQAIMYEGLTRFAWSISIAWVCFACIKGYGGVINSFLSWSFWIPIGRMTYCTYLIHPLVIYNSLISAKALFHFSIISFSYYYVGSLVFCYLAGLILSLLMEMPAAGLEKIIFR